MDENVFDEDVHCVAQQPTSALHVHEHVTHTHTKCFKAGEKRQRKTRYKDDQHLVLPAVVDDNLTANCPRDIMAYDTEAPSVKATDTPTIARASIKG